MSSAMFCVVDALQRQLRVVTPQNGKPVLHPIELSYDKDADSLYIDLADRGCVDSDDLNDGGVLDFDESGAAVGIVAQHVSKRADIHREILI